MAARAMPDSGALEERGFAIAFVLRCCAHGEQDYSEVRLGAGVFERRDEFDWRCDQDVFRRCWGISGDGRWVCECYERRLVAGSQFPKRVLHFQRE